MTQLNLPSFVYKIKRAEGKVWIWDLIRRKYIVLTPEEWVRQHFVQYLINDHNYPKSLIKVESGLSYNQLAKRSDIVVYNREGRPWMIVECKAPEQSLNRNTLEQASTYNASLRADYIVVTNGLEHHYFQTNWSEGNTTRLDQLPDYR